MISAAVTGVLPFPRSTTIFFKIGGLQDTSIGRWRANHLFVTSLNSVHLFDVRHSFQNSHLVPYRLHFTMSYVSVNLPSGREYILYTNYTSTESRAVEALVVASSLSLVSVVGLLIVIAISTVKTFGTGSQGVFVRSHVAAYFLSLMVTDLFQAVGSIMNSRWVRENSVVPDGFCTAQGAIKMAADVGTALWTLVIAIHTFNVLFLRIHPGKYTLACALIFGWSFIAIMVMLGPLSINNAANGPFFGISGYWCWISGGYPLERIVMDYMMIFIAAIGSFILYTLVYLRLRGNIELIGGRVRFISVSKSSNWQTETNESQARITAITKQMLLYPVAYTILILPIATVRFSEWTGHDVPFSVVIFTDFIFLLSGFVNSTLFVATRRILPFNNLPSLSRLLGRNDTSTTISPQFTIASENDILDGKSMTDEEKRIDPFVDISSHDGHSTGVRGLGDLEDGLAQDRTEVHHHVRGESVSPLLAPPFEEQQSSPYRPRALPETPGGGQHPRDNYV
ncbi:hypothetical protein BD410DRAFT_788484 [Rickenella mellea]|uniref:Uncharacterized protein n=1 Tax=Rickenella mellea TaxID=50990 RepID=A0A4Y7Q4Q9_9AGAM|nr:hypothetical protein BD410DRAFT_788484 [Rickenella mellea]